MVIQYERFSDFMAYLTSKGYRQIRLLPDAHLSGVYTVKNGNVIIAFYDSYNRRALMVYG